MAEQNGNKDAPAPITVADVTTFSNAVRLSGREWLAVGVFTVMLFLLPSAWKQWEPLPRDPDYRMPHDLSNDYWLYERLADQASQRDDAVLLGDSVVWGEYVAPGGTLSHYLNRLAGAEHYANLGLDGAHPLALLGLVRHYAGSISGKQVVLHCNPLWLTSPRRDLQDDKATEFNHPRLVPQFVPKIPSYKEEVSTRLGVVVEQHVGLSSWTTHLQQAYFDRTDIPSWTMEHPYDNPLERLTLELPPLDQSLRHPSRPWYKSGITKQDFPWIDLDTSLQWHAFQCTVQLLRKRGNRVFVLVGPFNEHLLNPESLRRYQEVKATITAWLKEQQVPHLVPPPLPSAQYGDASHPLAEGYELLAQKLWAEPSFPAAR
jgi:hypothetical protein